MKAPKLDLKLGAEPRKVAILGALLLVAAYFLYTNVFSPPEVGTPTRPAAPAKAPAVPKREEPAKAGPVTPREVPAGKSAARDFRPSLVPKKGAAPSDPTLHLEVLDKLAQVRIERVDRSLFDFAAEAPKPKLPEPKIEVKKPAKRMIGPEPPPPPPPPPVKPPPPPINLKFYGNALPLKDGVKRVFLIQGEDILIPSEGEVVQKRYKIVRINTNSVLVEDLDYKNQQTIPIDQPPPTG